MLEVSYVDPANVVYSYTEDPHFKDCFYWGEIKTVPIAELMKIDPTLTNDDLDTISKYSVRVGMITLIQHSFTKTIYSIVILVR